MNNGKTGLYWVSEASFDVNEMISVMGLVSLATDQYTGVPTAILTPPLAMATCTNSLKWLFQARHGPAAR
jgi:hypothetical protein